VRSIAANQSPLIRTGPQPNSHSASRLSRKKMGSRYDLIEKSAPRFEQGHRKIRITAPAYLDVCSLDLSRPDLRASEKFGRVRLRRGMGPGTDRPQTTSPRHRLVHHRESVSDTRRGGSSLPQHRRDFSNPWSARRQSRMPSRPKTCRPRREMTLSREKTEEVLRSARRDL